MAVSMVQEVLTVKLRYAVEQYGMLTGPFELTVKFHPEVLAKGVDPWEIITNTKPLYNSVFDNFFTTMESYLRLSVGIQPIEEVRSGSKKHFEMYFPDIHYDLDAKVFEKTNTKKRKPFNYN
jgi:hypothetical protein